MPDTWRDLEDRRSRVEQVRENATRNGRAYGRFLATGVGSVQHPHVFKFGSSFLEIPIFTFGAVIPDGSPFPADDPPRCTAGVFKWEKTSAGFYSGAWCWFVVDSYTAMENVKMLFTLAWEGVASKDIVSTAGFPMNKLDV